MTRKAKQGATARAASRWSPEVVDVPMRDELGVCHGIRYSSSRYYVLTLSSGSTIRRGRC